MIGVEEAALGQCVEAGRRIKVLIAGRRHAQDRGRLHPFASPTTRCYAMWPEVAIARVACLRAVVPIIVPIADQAAGLFYTRLFETAPYVRTLFNGAART
jgi:hypothetical protein